MLVRFHLSKASFILARVVCIPSQPSVVVETIAHYLRDHSLTGLFIDLGWEHDSPGAFSLTVDGRMLSFSHVAHKRGLRVVRCQTERAVLSNRGLLRAFQKLLSRTCHEHILIFTCEEPRKQVWQWAVRLPDGRSMRHREHPFFSQQPPPALLARLSELRVTLEEEENVRLVDALERVRRALDTTAELKLFARRPNYAERSDKLARAVQRGDPGAMHQFVLFHRPLARKISQRLQHWFDLPEDDAEQIGCLGLIEAAARFKPERGFQFSTYASWWIKHACQRLGPDAALLVRVPLGAFWNCFRLTHDIEHIEAAGGSAAVREHLAEMEVSDPWQANRLHAYRRARGIDTLSDRSLLRRAARIPDGTRPPIDRFLLADSVAEVRAALRHLDPRAAEVIRSRYGFDGEVQTLEAIGRRLHLTKERVRQIEAKAEQKLHGYLAGEEDVFQSDPDEPAVR